MNAHRKTRSVRRSEKRRRIMPPLRAGVNAAPIRLPFPDEDTAQDRGVAALARGMAECSGSAADLQVSGSGRADSWQTLGDWFVHRFGEQGLDLLARGDVLAGHGQIIGADYPYTPGERIWVFRPIRDEPSEPIVLPIAAENERYVIVEKPHGMATVPKGSHVAHSVLVAARRQMKNDLLIAAHRLDLETAGLVLLVKEPQWRGAYQKLFERRAIKKTYRAVAPLIGGDCAQAGERWHSELTLHKVEGQLTVSVVRDETAAGASQRAGGSADADTEINPLHGTPASEHHREVSRQISYYGERRGPSSRTQANSVTDIELERVSSHLGVYALYPHTGFTHQLRVAMNELGAPICGDPLYPRMMSLDEVAQREYSLQLLAASLEFNDPISGERVYVQSQQKLALE